MGQDGRGGISRPESTGILHKSILTLYLLSEELRVPAGGGGAKGGRHDRGGSDDCMGGSRDSHDGDDCDHGGGRDGHVSRYVMTLTLGEEGMSLTVIMGEWCASGFSLDIATLGGGE